MSGIQESVLTPFQWGKTPLLLITFDEADADYLSVMLSFHLKAENEEQAKAVNAQSNYFTNQAIRHLLSKHAKSENPHLADALKLALEEGFDTGSLRGLSLPATVLPQVNINAHFQEAMVLIVYNDFLQRSDSESLQEKKKPSTNRPNVQAVSEEIKKMLAANPHRTLLINSRYLISDPSTVLHFLAEKLQATIIKEEKLLPHSPLKEDLLLHETEIISDPTEQQFYRLNDSLSLLHPERRAADFIFIFHLSDRSKENRLFTKLLDLLAVFPETIHVHILCSTANAATHLQAQLFNMHPAWIDINISEIQQQFAATLNALLTANAARYFCIDMLSMQFNYAECVKQLSGHHASIVYPFSSTARQSRSITLNDLLTTSVPEAGLMIRTDTDVFFDAALQENYLFWDYCIQACGQQQTKCIAVPANLFSEKKHRQQTEHETADAGYKQVIQKHHNLIAGSVDAIIEQISSNSMISMQERKKMEENISSLQGILLHSKEELKSFQQLTAQLHHRIHYLENNWYHKIKTRIVRIRKIFFKKKSPGKGTLKRILQFIRFSFSKAGFGILRKILKNVLKKIYLIAENRPVQIIYLDENNHENIFTYDHWIKKKLDPDTQRNYYEVVLAKLTETPLISIIMPVYNTPLKYLKEAIESVLVQHYKYWELCIADDHSSDNKVKKMLHAYSVKDPRIKIVYRPENGHISAASNSALEIAKGDFILLLDHDDLLAVNCLAEVALALHENPEADIIYSDEDKTDERGIHQDPHFKPDWAPDHLLSRNYIGHVAVLRKSLIDRISGFRIGFEGSQDYDLLLRATELSNSIIHIPKVLYHWRIHTLSAAQGEDVKPYAYIAAKKALSEALDRRSLKGTVKYLSGLRGYKIEYELKKEEKVSIIIPTKDQTELLRNTVESIIEKTSYKNYEIIILNNNSTTKQLTDYLHECSKKYSGIVKSVEAHFPFNFSKLMNLGVQHASGQFYLLLNNDVEVIHHDWLATMLSYAQQERIGAVGVKLLYPDDTIQHAGVVVGLGGIAGHTFVGSYKDEAGYFNYIQSVNNYSAVTAACMMVSKSAYEKVNGMDETFEVEYNDVDFCLKLMEAGYNNVYLPQVELYHYESATRGHPHQSKSSYERHLKEMKLFKDKWQHIIDHDPHYNPNLNLGVHDFSMNFGA
jgi:GT2 family glycosyltransferase